MKQHITIEQLDELNDEGKEKLREWWKPEIGDIMSCNCDNPLQSVEFDEPGILLCKSRDNVGHSLPLLSIGQMIGFLMEETEIPKVDEINFYGQDYIDPKTDRAIVKFSIENQRRSWELNQGVDDELCDALWKAVKDILGEKE